MSTHIYAVGDKVSLDFHEGNALSKLDPFVVEARMPPLGTSLQYRIKSPSEICRRVVSEHQLSFFGPQPGAEQTEVVRDGSDKVH